MLRLCLIVFASSLAVCSCETGSCPPTLSVDICDATCGFSYPCNTTQICCPNACGGSMCVDPMTQRHFVTLASSLAVCSCEKGSCPPTLSVDICDATCGLSHACNTTQICCPTACGGSMCVDPMTQRHFVTLEKPGECPEYPRGVWICSHTCTGDSDYPRTLKCCANRCGALTCQRPENLPPPS